MKKDWIFLVFLSGFIFNPLLLRYSHAQEVSKNTEALNSYLLDIRVPEIYETKKKEQIELNLCFYVQTQIEKSELAKITVKCDFDQKLNPIDFDYHLSFHYLGDRFKLKAKINKTKTQVNDMQFSWDVKNNSYAIGKMVHRFVLFKDEANLMAIEDHAFKAGLEMSQEVTIDQNGSFLSKKTQDIISKEKAKELFLNEDFITLNGEYKKKNKEYLRSYLEVGGMLLVGGLTYQLLDFDVDKDFEYTWDGVRAKFTRGLRFDDNHRFYNFYAHPVVGAAYQVMARSNGLTTAEGYLLAFVSSALWEYGPEFVEVASINDQFQTAFGGPAMGNVIYDLGVYFRSSGNTRVAKSFKYVFGGIHAFHDYLDGTKPTVSENLDQWGLNANYWHKIDIFTEIAKTLDASSADGIKTGGMLTLNIQLDTVKRLDEAGRASKFVWDTLHSELAFDVGLDQNLQHDLNVLTKSVLFGLAKKNIFLDKQKRKNGYSFILGASAAYEVKEGDLAGKFDKYALVNILGPTLDIRFFIKGVKVRLALDVYANFSSIRSFAIETYQEKHQDQVIAATLENLKYYNGYGYSQNGKLEILYKSLGMDVNWRHSHTWSINGLDRNWDELTDKPDLIDRRTNLDANLFYNHKRTGLQLGVGYEFKDANSMIRNSQVTDEVFLAQENEHIVFFRMGFSI